METGRMSQSANVVARHARDSPIVAPGCCARREAVSRTRVACLGLRGQWRGAAQEDGMSGHTASPLSVSIRELAPVHAACADYVPKAEPGDIRT